MVLFLLIADIPWAIYRLPISEIIGYIVHLVYQRRLEQKKPWL